MSSKYCAIILLLLLPAFAQAQQVIRFDFTGTVTTSFNNGLDDPLEILGLTVDDGDLIEGFFTIDTAAPEIIRIDGSESGAIVGYEQGAVQQFQFTLASGLFSAEEEFGTFVINDFQDMMLSGFDSFGVGDGVSPGSSDSGLAGETFLLNGVAETGSIGLNFVSNFDDFTVFDSNDLPTSLDLNAFALASGTIRANRPNDSPNPDFFSVNFSIDSITAMPVSLPVIGDVNGDGVVDLLDVSPFIETLLSGEFQLEADINQDGTVDLLDVQPFVNLLLGA